jgi:hypothetical protein
VDRSVESERLAPSGGSIMVALAASDRGLLATDRAFFDPI